MVASCWLTLIPWVPTLICHDSRCQWDGKLDIISVNENGNTLSVLTNNGGGGFVLSSSPIVGNHPWGLTAADVNGDGKVDLISPEFF